MPPKKNDKKSTSTSTGAPTRLNAPSQTGSPKKQRTESATWKLPFSDAPMSAEVQHVMTTKFNGHPFYTYINVDAAKLFTYVTASSPPSNVD